MQYIEIKIILILHALYGYVGFSKYAVCPGQRKSAKNNAESKKMIMWCIKLYQLFEKLKE